MTFVVIDYSKGNLRSVQKGLELAGAEAIISADPEVIRTAQALVLPGVGSFADASQVMRETGQMQAVRESIERGTPFLGICLGMQLLFEQGFEGSEDGEPVPGLGILKGAVERVRDTDAKGKHYKVPHVGWNQVVLTAEAQQNAVFMRFNEGIEDGSNFYFVHSYRCAPENPEDIMATTTYADEFPSTVCRGRVFGVQHHPEKSSHKGLMMLRNFVQFTESLGEV